MRRCRYGPDRCERARERGGWLIFEHSQCVRLLSGCWCLRDNQDFDTAQKLAKGSVATTVVGTSSYMAPELFQETGVAYDFKVDSMYIRDTHTHTLSLSLSSVLIGIAYLKSILSEWCCTNFLHSSLHTLESKHLSSPRVQPLASFHHCHHTSSCSRSMHHWYRFFVRAQTLIQQSDRQHCKYSICWVLRTHHSACLAPYLMQSPLPLPRK
jgi:serine/threonine protein kinase